MEIEPWPGLYVDSEKVTKHQLDILVMISRTHSQTQSARKLGISVPVLHRYIRNLEKRIGYELIITTPNGTWLTPEGKRIVREYKRYQKIIEQPLLPVVACTLVTQDMVLAAVSELERDGVGFNVVVSDDNHNRELAWVRGLDLVLFDDPQNVYEFEDKGEHFDIFEDHLAHIENGNKYVKFRFGAQRIGFKYLDLNNVEYTVISNVSDVNELINSNYSYFINRSLMLNKNLKLKSSKDRNEYKHMIMALNLSERPEIFRLVDVLKRLALNLTK